MNALGVVISTYDSVEDVRVNVRRIRKTWGPLSSVPIVVVSTHPEAASLFGELENTGLSLVCFTEAPGNPGVLWNSLENPAGPYASWRNEFLPPRILISIEKGLTKAYELGCKAVLHLHADTHWDGHLIDRLIDDANWVLEGEHGVVGDLSYFNEQSAEQNKVIPPGLHFQPEGLIFNLEVCRRTGYGFTFSRVFDRTAGFRSHNYGSVEALLGQYLHFCLTGRNIESMDDLVSSSYWKHLRIRTVRPYHGAFASGLVNVPPGRTIADYLPDSLWGKLVKRTRELFRTRFDDETSELFYAKARYAYDKSHSV